MAFHPAIPQNPKFGDMWFDPINNEYMMWNGHSWIAQKGPIGSMHINTPVNAPITFHEEPTKHMKFQVKTNYGVIVANLNTGELTIPAGVARDAALREFWMGFLEHYRPSGGDPNAIANRQRIKELENELYMMKEKSDKHATYVFKETVGGIVNKITKKYGSEKLIMVKPSDLVKLIEE